MTGAFARILMRVIAGALLYKGYIAASDAEYFGGDPELAMVAEMALGGLVWAAAELWYRLAKRMGWPT